MSDKPKDYAQAMREEREAFQRFADKSAWIDDGTETIKRKPMDDIPSATFEIVKDGNYFHAIAIWSTGEYRDYSDNKFSPFSSLLEAKKYLFHRYQEICRMKSDFQENHPPAKND